MSARYVGVDLGSKRIGLAISDANCRIVWPLSVIETPPNLEQTALAILDVVAEYEAGGVVIGLPLNMDGSEGPQARFSKQLAEAVRKAASNTGTPSLEIHLHDERLTSHAADQRLRDRDLTRKKKKIRQDAVAAQILLESFIETRVGRQD